VNHYFFALLLLLSHVTQPLFAFINITVSFTYVTRSAKRGLTAFPNSQVWLIITLCLMYHFQFTPSTSAVLKVTKFQGSTIFTSHVMGHHVHTIGKAIRPLFADPVTYIRLTAITWLTTPWPLAITGTCIICTYHKPQ